MEHEVSPGISVLPLQTPTLPPATHTNCYFVGTSRFFIVEPATYDADERTKLFSAIDRWISNGRSPTAVVLTHHHGDHVGSAQAVRDRYEIPVIAHENTRALLEGFVSVDELVGEGSTLEVDGRAFEVLFTPGHAPGHITLRDRDIMIVGDMVAGVGTILIDPDEGDMARYIDELRRLAALNPRILLPSHGPAIDPGTPKLLAYVAHRLMREAKVLDALKRRGESTAGDLLADAYDDTPASVYPIAERSCLAHLLKLEREGRAARSGERFFAT
ncbi:MAG: MBL fold metallo-hydrolase [Deltaproteobacteria bacterium]|nr:MBL fold metallo-hydrolase [Deltaproteobacteria bacterium]